MLDHYIINSEPLNFTEDVETIEKNNLRVAGQTWPVGVVPH